MEKLFQSFPAFRQRGSEDKTRTGATTMTGTARLSGAGRLSRRMGGAAARATRRNENARVAEPVYEPLVRNPQQQRFNRGRGTDPRENRRRVLQILGGAAAVWLARTLLVDDDAYVWVDDDGMLFKEDAYGTYPLGPDVDGSKAIELGAEFD